MKAFSAEMTGLVTERCKPLKGCEALYKFGLEDSMLGV